ncbi:MAG: DUF1631 domain-containing protein [Lysobacterales bacterium]
MLPSLGRRADLPPRVRALLDGLLERSSLHFETAVAHVLDEVEHEFFKLAERAGNNVQQQKHFENLRAIKLDRADVVPGFLQYVEAELARVRSVRPAAAPPPLPQRGDTLELLESSVLEEDLALQEIANKSEIRHSLALHALSQRLGVIAGSPAWPNETLPLGPAHLATAFRFALHKQGLDVEHRVRAYRQFDRIAMLPIGAFYEELNTYLAAERVLPHLRFQSAHRYAEPARDAAAEPAAPLSPPQNAASVESAPPASPGDAELFKTLRHLLGERRVADGDRRVASRTDAHLASQGDLQSVLGGLQRGAARAAGEHDAEHFKNTLLVKLRRASPQGRPLDLAEEDSDTIDLVGMLFDHISREMRDGSGARALINGLHVPVLRVALGDKTFFTRRDHPARELLNTIAETGSRWIDDTDADPELTGKMQRVVDHVGADFDGDLSVFENLLDDLSRHMQMLARRAEIAERRHIDAARGRDKLEIAREAARIAIARLLQNTAPSPTVRALLERAWTDALALSALRQGEHGSEFKRRVAVAESLVRHAAAPAEAVDDSLRSELDAGLRQVGLHGDDVRGVLDNLFSNTDAREASKETLSRIDHALRDKTRLGGESAPPATAAAKSERAKVPLSAAETEALEKLRKLPFGSWFDFVTNQQGTAVRRKLAWYSTMTGHCLFVNQRGARVDDMTLEQLARDMVRGQARVVDTDRTSLIDRAWKAIVDALRPHAAAPAKAGAA